MILFIFGLILAISLKTTDIARWAAAEFKGQQLEKRTQKEWKKKTSWYNCIECDWYKCKWERRKSTWEMFKFYTS